MGAAGKDAEYGNGAVDAYAALLAAGGDEVNIGYCNSQGESVADEWISEFRLGDYVNVSDARSYSDFTDEVISVDAGQSYSISITPTYSGQIYPDAFRVWIDYNKDEVFEATELVFQAGPTSETVTGTIVIPDNLTGTTRLRVSMKFEAFSEACELFEYGEVEDYTISFDGGNEIADCGVPTNLAATDFGTQSANLVWAAVENALAYDMRIKQTGGEWIDFSDLSSTSIQLTNFTIGTTYEFAVRARCTSEVTSDYSENYVFQYTEEQTDVQDYCVAKGTTSQFQWIDLIELNEIVNPSGDNEGYGDFTNLTANIQRGNLETIYISKGPSTTYVFEWNVFIDYNQNGIFEIEELALKGASASNDVLYGEFEVPTDALLGETRLRVLMKYNAETDPCEEFPYGEVEDYTVNIQAIAGNNLGNRRSLAAQALNESVVESPITVFPNPTSDYIAFSNALTIGNQLTILNVQGQVVWSTATWNGEQIEVRNLPKGYYVVQYMQDGERQTAPFVKQ